MSSSGPNVYVVGGANGAGKSTCARALLCEVEIEDYVNADTIARGFSAFGSDDHAVVAGRVMLERLDDYQERRRSFAFETTMASRGFARRMRRLREDGYGVHSFYIWVSDPSTAVTRVERRVHAGGHPIPSDTSCGATVAV